MKIVSFLLIGWVIVIWNIKEIMIYDFNPTIAKTLTPEQARHLIDCSSTLYVFMLIPMTILAGMWALAFFCERRNQL